MPSNLVIKVPTIKCVECNVLMPITLVRCPNIKCRAWNVAKSSKQQSIAVRLSEVKSEPLKEVDVPLLRDALRGGLIQTYAYLLGGIQGAGKTRLCLQLADYLASLNQRDVLYIGNEQSDRELEVTAKTLELKNMYNIVLIKAMGGAPFDLTAFLEEYKPCAMFLDSLKRWCGDDLQLAVRVTEAFKDLAVKYECPAILINQVNKYGEHHGLNELQHAPDCVMTLYVDEENPTPETPRSLIVSKHRNRPAPIEVIYQMNDKGQLLPIPKNGDE